MGKNSQQKYNGISFHHNPAGFMRGIFSLLKYHHWRYIKKRLPQRRHGERRHHVGTKSPRKASNADDFRALVNAELDNCTVQEELRKPTSSTKHSVKARIKALITEEKSKRKGKHHRSSTYPVNSKLTRSDSMHRLEHVDKDPLAHIVLDDEIPQVIDQNNGISSTISTQDPFLLKSYEESSSSGKREEDCGNVLYGNDLGSNQVDNNQEQLFEDHKLPLKELKREMRSLLDAKPVHAHEFMDDSPSQSKVFLDALDLININKEFLLNILEDPDSLLARHFHSQQALSTKITLSKCRSIPVRGSSGRKGCGSSVVEQKEEGSASNISGRGKSPELDSAEYVCKKSMPVIAAEYRADGIKLNQSMAEMATNSSGSGHHLKKCLENQVAVKRFKDLRRKIRYAIKESKKERQRIAMDAVLHKIPHKHGFSKDLSPELVDQIKDPLINRGRKDTNGSNECDHSDPPINKSGFHHIRRTSSLGHSMDRYLHLYECTFKREPKHQTSDKLQLRTEEVALPCRGTPKFLGRILSLPELKSFSYFSEDSANAFCSRMHTQSSGSLSSLDERSITAAPEDHLHCNSFGKSEIPDNFSGTNSVTEDRLGSTSVVNSESNLKVESDNDLGNLVAGDRGSSNDQDIEPASKSTVELAEASPLLVPGFSCEDDFAEFSVSEDSELNQRHLCPDQHDCLVGQHPESIMDNHTVAEGQLELKEVEAPLDNYIVLVPVDDKDKAKFDYVRDVLQLSGFSGNESLGTWHSDDQPVDPSIHEEVKGCMLLDPECSGNEEGGNCNHLLMIDVINEVLMEVYERSYSYCPMPLSSLCHLRPMPVGYHVLEEVWTSVSWYMRSRPEDDQSLDYVVSRDLGRTDGWMNLQFDTECVGLEVEDMIFDDLLDEALWD